MEINIIDAGDVARQRFYNYLDEKLNKDEWDTTKWEFYTFLLEQAKNHKLDISGYGSLEYQKDKDKAKHIRREGEKQKERGGFQMKKNKDSMPFEQACERAKWYGKVELGNKFALFGDAQTGFYLSKPGQQDIIATKEAYEEIISKIPKTEQKQEERGSIRR